MARQFRSDDTSRWVHGFGSGKAGDYTVSSNLTAADITPITYAGIYNGNILVLTDLWNNSDPGLVFQVGEYVLIHQTQGTNAGAWELNRIATKTWMSSPNRWDCTLQYPLQNTYASYTGSPVGLQVMQLVQWRNFTINNGVTFSANAWDGYRLGFVPLLVSGTFTNNGTVTASGFGFRGGYGHPGYQGTGRAYTGYTGESYNATVNAAGGGGGSDSGGYVSPASGQYGGGGGAGRASRGTDGSSGGAGAGYAAAGAAGGSVTGDNPQYPGGEAGQAYGIANLTGLHLGSGGGAGGIQTYFGNDLGRGGTGGGVIFVMARNFVNNGTIASNGANGMVDEHRHGGGGSGGSILIKAQSATLGTMTASGGIGGDGTGGVRRGSGGNGSVGRIHLDYVVSYSGSTTPAIDVTQDLTLRQPISRRMTI